jgi:DNA polymerase (family 10)
METNKQPAEARMDNAGVARILTLLADLLEIQGENSFKIAAYRRAAAAIEQLGEDIAVVWREGRLASIPGVGAALEKKLDEMLRTGDLALLRRVQAQIPPGVVQLLQIPGVGPRTAKKLWDAGILSPADAEAAARAGRLRELPGLGARTEARILAGVEALLQNRE